MSFFELSDDAEDERTRLMDAYDELLDGDDDDDEYLSSGGDSFDVEMPAQPQPRVEEIDSDADLEDLFRDVDERRGYDEDELGPPEGFTFQNYQEDYRKFTHHLQELTAWTEQYLEMLSDDPKGHRSPRQRMEKLWYMWLEYMIGYETLLSDPMMLNTHVDRTVKVVHGADAFASMLQLYFAWHFPILWKARLELQERYDMYHDEDLLDDCQGMTRDRYPGGWGDPRNAEIRWDRSEELRGEPRGIRLYRIRVTHLGILFDAWITRLTKEEYEEEKRLLAMPHEAYCRHIQTDKSPEEVNPFIPSDRVCLPHWKRVVEYTQNEVIRAVKLFSRDCDRLEPTQELRDFFDALLYRAALFFTESGPAKVMDDVDHRLRKKIGPNRYTYIFNRRFSAFTYYYFFPQLRQFYYYDMYADEGNQFQPTFRADPRNDGKDLRWLLKKGETRDGERFQRRARLDDLLGCTDDERRAVRTWVVDTVLPGLGEEGVNELYEECVEELYRCPGDLNLFNFLKEIDIPDNTSAVLQKVRPEDPDLSSELFQEYEISLNSIINGVGVNQSSDIFMLWAIGRYWESLVRSGMDWKETYVIEADKITASTLTIQESTRPLLVQIFGTHYVMFEGRAHKPRDILDAVTLWFVIIKRWFDGCLDWEVKSGGRYVPRIQIKDLVEEIFHPKERYADRGEMLHDRPLE